ncbi:hypothetical protein [Promicromonospora kroppenstedtii]|uniref:hypothetical protein n=1 Tax=Promicromonospora kroppenstedtii TaxID=440482 RepID=UPI0004B7C1DB|nr:hypothetical protein [Promicromonospora kroppenstedtii]
MSIDIDPWVTARAVECLAATGYGERVAVLTGDGELAVEGHGPFDAILVTVGAWDIAPAWLDQLCPQGLLVQYRWLLRARSGRFHELVPCLEDAGSNRSGTDSFTELVKRQWGRVEILRRTG